MRLTRSSVWSRPPTRLLWRALSPEVEQPTMKLYTLTARDPLRYRRLDHDVAAGWDIDTDPPMLANLLASMATTMARLWRERYGVSMPIPRIEWTMSSYGA